MGILRFDVLIQKTTKTLIFRLHEKVYFIFDNIRNFCDGIIVMIFCRILLTMLIALLLLKVFKPVLSLKD